MAIVRGKIRPFVRNPLNHKKHLVDPSVLAIKALRAYKGMRQYEIALPLGIKASTCKDYESGRTLMDAKQVRDMARFFDISPLVVLGVMPFNPDEDQPFTLHDPATQYGKDTKAYQNFETALETQHKLILSQEERIRELKNALAEKDQLITFLKNQPR